MKATNSAGLEIKRNFNGNERTAQRCMRLAAAVSDPVFLRGLSIRQACLRLGIATEPKSQAQTTSDATRRRAKHSGNSASAGLPSPASIRRSPILC